MSFKAGMRKCCSVLNSENGHALVLLLFGIFPLCFSIGLSLIVLFPAVFFDVLLIDVTHPIVLQNQGDGAAFRAIRVVP